MAEKGASAKSYTMDGYRNCKAHYYLRSPGMEESHGYGESLQYTTGGVKRQTKPLARLRYEWNRWNPKQLDLYSIFDSNKF